MLGVVFTEFCAMVEEKYSADMLDEIIEMSDLSSGGAYTAVGNYSHKEMLNLVQALSRKTGIAANELIRSFGYHLFDFFGQNYSVFFDGVGSSFDFLKTIDDHIHVEVRKLYPEAAPPSFEFHESGPGQATLTYRSHRPFADLAEGLILACGDYFKESLSLDRSEMPDGSVLFTVSRA